MVEVLAEVKEKACRYVRVAKTGTEGYIMKSNLKVITEKEAQSHSDMTGKGAAVPTLDLWANININKGHVNFRKEASKRGDLIDRLNSDSKVWVYTVRTVEGERWYKVRYDNQEGYIVEQYVKLMSPEESDKCQNNLPSPMPTQTLRPENGSCEHSYKYNYENDQYHYLKCSQCGDRQQHQEHNGTATCTQKAQCTNCGKEYGEPLGHNWSDAWEKDSTNHWKKCTRCGEKKEKAAHIGGTATCTEQAQCDVCGYPYGKLREHDWVNDPPKEPTCIESGKTAGKYCRNCGCKEGGEEIPATGHNYENGKCSNCGATDPNQKPTEPPFPPGDNGGTGDTSSGGENPSGGEDSKGESASSILDKRLAELEEIIRSYREA